MELGGTGFSGWVKWQNGIPEPKALQNEARSCDEQHMVPGNAVGIFEGFRDVEREVFDESADDE